MVESRAVKKRGGFAWIAFVALLLVAATLQLGILPAEAAQATLTWTAPTTYTNGTSLTSLGGYKVYVGTTSGSYSQNFDAGNVTSYTVSNLNDSTTYYFAVSAYDTSGVVSALSNQLSVTTAAPAPAPTIYSITASAGSGGSISPSGAIAVTQGLSQSFTITPASGYQVAAVTVDGVSVGALTSYTFSNISANHTIAASFTSTTATSTATSGTTSSTTWQNKATTPLSAALTATFDLIPNANNMDGITSLSAVPITGFADGAVMVRFNTSGTIDVRNGGTYAATTSVPYTAGKSYHFRMQIDVAHHLYDVYVTPAGGTEIKIASGYAFRTEQSGISVINNVGIYADSGSHQLLNFSLTSPTMVGSTTWLNQAIASQTGTFTANFDLIPNANNMDGVTSLSAIPITGFTDGAATVRFNTSGTIDARKGGTYAAATSIPYAAGKTYHVRMRVNIPSHVYDVYVTPPGGSEIQLASSYAFRTEQAGITAINNLGMYDAAGSHQLLNLAITAN